MQTDERFENRHIIGSSGGLFWNVLTILVLMGIFFIVVLFYLIYTNPYISLNPFPPPRLSVNQVLATSTLVFTTETATVTSTKIIFPPTWTPTFTLSPTNTATSKPPTPTLTVTQPIFPTSTTTSTPADRPDMPFAVLGTPESFASTVFHPSSDCKWMGVGGKTVDMQDAPIVGITVELGGYLGSTYINLLSLTGTALQYGTAGYEFTLSNQPIASIKTLWIQLLDQAGLPLSNRVYFDTYNDCQKNLELITFKQVR
jgi:hypothetical protein